MRLFIGGLAQLFASLVPMALVCMAMLSMADDEPPQLQLHLHVVQEYVTLHVKVHEAQQEIWIKSTGVEMPFGTIMHVQLLDRKTVDDKGTEWVEAVFTIQPLKQPAK